ncbi:MAG TPA: methyltransferase, partial [Acidimicrobiia bacterium]|nr:methyltransferase [Acidimicrobiia bacterium]
MTTAESDPVADVYAMADLVTPMAIRVAATLRVADHIAQGLRTVRRIADAVHADPDALDRVLRHLTIAGLLSRDGSGEYALTPHGNALRDDHPGRVRARLDIDDALGRAELSLVQLLHAVRTGEPAFPVQFGLQFWDDLASDPARRASFDTHMGTDVTAWAPAIISAYDWGPLEHVIDVGGGNGSLLIALLTAYPSLRGMVFDLPATAAGAALLLAEAGLADRCDVAGGRFFDALPGGAGAYVLTAVIHNWDEESALAMLRRCAGAAGSLGKVFIIEKIGADGVNVNTAVDL